MLTTTTCVPHRAHHGETEHGVCGEGGGHLPAGGAVSQPVLRHGVLSRVPVLVGVGEVCILNQVDHFANAVTLPSELF